MEAKLEEILSRKIKDEMIEYIQSHPNQFESLIKLAISNKPPHSSKAAWLLSKCMHENDIRIQNHCPKIIDALSLVKDGQQRELINILRKMEIDEEDEGRLFDSCVNIWCKLNKIPSVRYIAFRFILETVKKYPALYNEVVLLTEEYYLAPLSKGIKHSIQRLINELAEENQA